MGGGAQLAVGASVGAMLLIFLLGVACGRRTKTANMCANVCAAATSQSYCASPTKDERETVASHEEGGAPEEELVEQEIPVDLEEVGKESEGESEEESVEGDGTKAKMAKKKARSLTRSLGRGSWWNSRGQSSKVKKTGRFVAIQQRDDSSTRPTARAAGHAANVNAPKTSVLD